MTRAAAEANDLATSTNDPKSLALSAVTCVQICFGAGMVYTAAGGSRAGHPWSL